MPGRNFLKQSSLSVGTESLSFPVAPGQVAPGQVVPGQVVPGQVAPGTIEHGIFQPPFTPTNQPA